MTSLDQFESAFARADKVQFQRTPRKVDKVLFLTDLDDEAAARHLAEIKPFLAALDENQERPPVWVTLGGNAYSSGQDLLEKLSEHQPDLIVCHRMLKELSRESTYSLGTYLDVLSQAVAAPLLVVPRDVTRLNSAEGTPQVMAITSHMTGDDALVNWALSFVRGAEGDLFLTHIEDDLVFRRYLDVIGKIQGLDTDTAETAIQAQLLKEPAEFIESVQAALASAGSRVKVHPVVRLGHRVQEYAALVKEHSVDLLVIEGKDESQAAMSGLAYSLAVELTFHPILIL